MASLSHLTSAHRSRTFCKSTFLWKHIEKKLSYGHFQTQTSRGKKAVYSAEGRRQFILLQTAQPLLFQWHCQPFFLEHFETKPMGCVLLPVAMGVFKENLRQGISALGT